MATSKHPLTLGLPRMHKEVGERRDFLPDLVRRVCALGVEVCVETGIGSGMGLSDDDYTAVSPQVRVVDNLEAFRQDVVLILRFPELEELEKLRRGATLISMIHFPTRPRRVRRLQALGVQAISLDSLADDQGRRVVENMRAVAWNGLEAAFDALERTWPALRDPARAPVRVMVMGAGLVGKDAVEASIKCGRLERAAEFTRLGLPGVEVVAVGSSLTGRTDYMRERLARTDVLVDATQRRDPTRPVVPNEWIAHLPPHAVICDLAVDPYILEVDPPTVRGVEGIPRGDLDQYIFLADDFGWDRTVPQEVPSRNRRAVVSCYSWPGVHPRECMEHYGRQLGPLLESLFQRMGLAGVRRDGDPQERALFRGSLHGWLEASGATAQETDTAGD